MTFDVNFPVNSWIWLLRLPCINSGVESETCQTTRRAAKRIFTGFRPAFRYRRNGKMSPENGEIVHRIWTCLPFPYPSENFYVHTVLSTSGSFKKSRWSPLCGQGRDKLCKATQVILHGIVSPDCVKSLWSSYTGSYLQRQRERVAPTLRAGGFIWSNMLNYRRKNWIILMIVCHL